MQALKWITRKRKKKWKFKLYNWDKSSKRFSELEHTIKFDTLLSEKKSTRTNYSTHRKCSEFYATNSININYYCYHKFKWAKIPRDIKVFHRHFFYLQIKSNMNTFIYIFSMKKSSFLPNCLHQLISKKKRAYKHSSLYRYTYF